MLRVGLTSLSCSSYLFVVRASSVSDPKYRQILPDIRKYVTQNPYLVTSGTEPTTKKSPKVQSTSFSRFPGVVCHVHNKYLSIVHYTYLKHIHGTSRFLSLPRPETELPGPCILLGQSRSAFVINILDYA
ncbi:hypothetical protein F4860DRAFT_193839 [Xylaria cubensis]|nr:hypothetical protein F4860DRAFT_193839 [Xylaria cubensis]